MSSPQPAIRELARRLIALETSGVAPTGGEARVCEKLRVPLAKLAGAAGYRSLLSRAVAVAKRENPALGPVQIGPDGSLEGLSEIIEKNEQAASAVLVHLLGLLVTFIGAPLTLGLVSDVWPDAAGEDADLSAEEQQ